MSSKETLSRVTESELVDGLRSLHAFHDSVKWTDNIDDAILEFITSNSLVKVKGSLSYLLFDPHSAAERIARVIYEPELRLKGFGPSSAQELVGWVNDEDLPVVNQRTEKVLHFLGLVR